MRRGSRSWRASSFLLLVFQIHRLSLTSGRVVCGQTGWVCFTTSWARGLMCAATVPLFVLLTSIRILRENDAHINQCYFILIIICVHVKVHIINLLQDSKFQHFKPVMDTYIESHFAGALSYRYVTPRPSTSLRCNCSRLRRPLERDAALPTYCILIPFVISWVGTQRTCVSAEGQLDSRLCWDLVTSHVNEMLIVPSGG